MLNWLPASLLALFSFGLWGLFTKLSVKYVDPQSAFIYQTLGVIVVTGIILSFMHFKPTVDLKGVGYGTLTGITYGLGCLFYFFAVTRGKIITVVTLTALYPLITIMLSFIFLHEVITSRQICGVLLALVAILMMSL
jgi:transporter family protein